MFDDTKLNLRLSQIFGTLTNVLIPRWINDHLNIIFFLLSVQNQCLGKKKI